MSDTGTYPFRVKKDDYCLYERGNMHMCYNCKQCWVHTPGCCVIQDSLQHLAAMLELSDEVVIVSRCWYGSVSPFIAMVLERTLPYLCGLVNSFNGEHKLRSKHTFRLSVYFYGEDITEEEKALAIQWLHMFAHTMQAEMGNIAFYHDILEMGANV